MAQIRFSGPELHRLLVIGHGAKTTAPQCRQCPSQNARAHSTPIITLPVNFLSCLDCKAGGQCLDSSLEALG